MMVGLVLSNLLFPLVAVVVAALLCGVVVLRHRRPKSVEANMRAFNKGLRALAPPDHKPRPPAPRVAQRRVTPILPSSEDPVDEVEAETG